VWCVEQNPEAGREPSHRPAARPEWLHRPHGPVPGVESTDGHHPDVHRQRPQSPVSVSIQELCRRVSTTDAAVALPVAATGVCGLAPTKSAARSRRSWATFWTSRAFRRRLPLRVPWHVPHLPLCVCVCGSELEFTDNEIFGSLPTRLGRLSRLKCAQRRRLVVVAVGVSLMVCVPCGAVQPAGPWIQPYRRLHSRQLRWLDVTQVGRGCLLVVSRWTPLTLTSRCVQDALAGRQLHHGHGA
jgi:hypothetical protein